MGMGHWWPGHCHRWGWAWFLVLAPSPQAFSKAFWACMIVVDIEASGVDPQKHALVSIGAVDFHHPDRQFYGECRVWKGAEWTEEALEVNGFTVEELQNPHKDSLADLLEQFLAWQSGLPDKTLAGQHTAFDRDFLNTSLQRCGFGFRFSKRTLDLHTLCYAHYVRR